MFVTTINNVEGLYCWKDAPKHTDYLRNKHRHIFVIECGYSVEKTDREVEIIESQHKIEQLLKQNFYNDDYNMCDFGNMSCEDICLFLLNKCKEISFVKVTEDGYGGAYVRR